MNAPPLVRAARVGEDACVADILTQAFVDEAGLNYWLRQGKVKTRARRRFFEAVVGTVMHAERELWLAQAETGEALGAAVWLGPGCKAFDFSLPRQIALSPMLFDIAGFAGMFRGFDLGERLDALHPAVAHAHLTFIGVGPRAQGQGVGSALLKATLAPLDAARTPAYLETSTERNVALYAGHGFEVCGEVELPGLRMWGMVRRPR